MGIIYFLIGCSVFIAIIFLGAFIWANKSGQHDDTDTPAMRMLFDNDLSNYSEPEQSPPKSSKK